MSDSNDRQVNFGTVAKDYALYRNDFPEIVLDQLKQRGLDFSNRSVADLGCGTGIVTRLLAERGARVVGVEPSKELLDEAYSIPVNGDSDFSIEYVNAAAEETGLVENSFDVVTAVRAWHWFDRQKVISEIKRILKAKGFLAVIDSAFIPGESQLAQDTIEMIKSYMPGGVLKPAGSKAETNERRNGFPANWFAEWEEAGFGLIDSWQTKYAVSFSHEEWRGRVRSLSWISSMNEEERKGLDGELAAYLSNHYPDQRVEVPHVCSVVLMKI